MASYDENATDSVAATDTPLVDIDWLLSENLSMSEVWIADHGLLVADSVIMLDTSVSSVAWAISDTANIVSSLVGQSLFTVSVSQSFAVADAVKFVVDIVASDSLAASGSLSEQINRMVAIADTLVATGEASSQLEAHIFLSTVAAMATANEVAWHVIAADATNVSVDLTPTFNQYLSILASASMTDSASPGLVIATSVADSVAVLSDQATNFIEFIESLGDTIEFGGVLQLPDGSYYNAWVSNLHTGAPFKYTNYPFNSFAVSGERQYGCTADGLYELTGSDDAGVDIDAVLRSGLIDFGTAFIKNMEVAYLGYSADGDLYLKVIDSDGGTERAVVYQLSQTNDAVAENRLELGRGVKARYWQFEVSNVDGSDFFIDTLDVLPVILNRRR